MSRGFWLREAHSVVFYEVLRLCGGQIINGLKGAGGSAKEAPHVRGGRGGGTGSGGAGFDECIEDSGSGRLNPSCFTRI